MSEKIAFVGIGIMGQPLVQRLLSAGYPVFTFARRPKVAKPLIEQGAILCDTPADAANEANLCFSMVSDTPDVEQVILGKHGFVNGATRGDVIVDMSTISPEVTRKIASTLSTQGIEMLDAPVSGGQAGAENGILTVMVGGDQSAFDKAKPMIDCFAQSVMLMGKSGSGQLTKMVNQICIAGLVQGLSEGLAFGVNAGLDCNQVFQVISKGAASSWQMINRNETMLKNEFEFGFAVDWMRKDLGLCMDEAKKNGSELPITKIVDGYYAEIQAKGGSRYDTSSLVTRLYRKDLAN